MSSPTPHRRLSNYQRMVKVEELIAKVTIPLAIAALAAVLAFGLFNSTGHVTW